MHPILAEIGGYEISAYSVFLFLASLAAVFGGAFLASKHGFDRLETLKILSCSLIASFIGARLLHIATNIALYQEDYLLIFNLDTKGFSLFGGIISAMMIGFILFRRYKIDPFAFADFIIPAIGISIAIVRIGCFLNGCCFGHETSVLWGVSFPILSPAHRYQLSTGQAGIFTVLPVHPTQLYEMTAALIGSFLAWRISKTNIQPGSASFMIGACFAVFRLANLNFRVPAQTFDASPLFYPIFYFSFIIFCVTIAVLRLRR